MKITLEQVEQLRERSNCSYEEAKIALENSGGNILDALILLEKAGLVKQNGGFFSTKGLPRTNLADFIVTKETDEVTGEEEHKVSVSAYLRAAGATAKDVADDMVENLKRQFKKD